MSNGIIDRTLAMITDNNPELLSDVKEVMSKVDNLSNTLDKIKTSLYITGGALIVIFLVWLIIYIVRGRK